jgi:hypothetical protein
MDTDELLFRYRSASSFGRVLQEVSCIQWFSTAEHLNDPFDGVVGRETNPIDETRILKSKLDNGEEYINTVRIAGTEKWVVACYTPNWNSAPMWSHYASDGAGFCLGYDPKVVISRVKEHQAIPLVGTGSAVVSGYVKYVEVLPDTSSPIEELILSKSNDWSYEKEWRVATVGFEHQSRSGGIMVNLHGALKQVLVGWRAGSETYTPLIDMVNKLRERGEDVRIGVVRINNPERKIHLDWPWESHMVSIGSEKKA